MKKRSRLAWPPPDTFAPMCEICGVELEKDAQPKMILGKLTFICAEDRDALAEVADEVPTWIR